MGACCPEAFARRLTDPRLVLTTPKDGVIGLPDRLTGVNTTSRKPVRMTGEGSVANTWPPERSYVTTARNTATTGCSRALTGPGASRVVDVVATRTYAAHLD